MKEAEQAFLAQVALGWFSIRADGTIWRHARWSQGGTPRLLRLEAQRAEQSESDGYPTVMFYEPMSSRRLKVFAHRIVWMATTGQVIPEPMQINHVDGVRANAHPTNLELVTPAENVRHGLRVLGRRKKAQDGEENAQAKLTERSVAEIRTLWDARAMSQKALGERFNVKQATISAIVLRKSWRHVA
jgi:hypothetical protein